MSHNHKEDLIALFLAILYHLFLILGVYFEIIRLLFVALVLGVIVGMNFAKREPEERDVILNIYMYFILFIIFMFAITGNLS